jgi:hypothetical protein
MRYTAGAYEIAFRVASQPEIVPDHGTARRQSEPRHASITQPFSLMNAPMMFTSTRLLRSFILLGYCLCSVTSAFGQAGAVRTETLDAERHHLRTGETREWSRFPSSAEGAILELEFVVHDASTPVTLAIRQSDVRQTWRVRVNEQEVGRLIKDENDLISLFEIPADLVQRGRNRLTLEGQGDDPDDVLVGPIRLIEGTADAWLSETRVSVQVRDSETNEPMPSRLTITDADGSLVPIGAESNDEMAVRTGVIYTAAGKAEFGLPAGEYQVFAGRGFEYDRKQHNLRLVTGQSKRITCHIGRQVDTLGWIACDTHIHTLSHSGHGDASLNERVITIAGEGIELPIATEHNKQVSYEQVAMKLGVRKFFTPVVGNEVTTKFGHFNAFPFRADSDVPDHRVKDWQPLISGIFSTPDVQVVILNHARDRHYGYRPFGPENFNELTAESLDDRAFLFNAMETLNSGAQQTDPFELFRDWMALVNRGYKITPIGSSDSHDVNRYIVGQGRTYIRGSDQDPSEIDVASACKHIAEGKVIVSAGMFVDVIVNQAFGPGDTVLKPSRTLKVKYSIRCPDWLSADKVTLFQNGQAIQTRSLAGPNDLEGEWEIPVPSHDVFLTVLASGPGVEHPAWPIAQPYQPDSPDWTPKVLSFTGAIRVDADGDGSFQSAFEIAESLVSLAGGDLERLVGLLSDYDRSVALQAASLLRAKLGSLFDSRVEEAMEQASQNVRNAFLDYRNEWRKGEVARLENR